MRRMNDFAALREVNYDTLVLNGVPPGVASNGLQQPVSLVDQCCTSICRLGSAAVALSLQSMPVHLSGTLMQEAIRTQDTLAVAAIVANWPQHTLCFREIVSGEMKELFVDDVGMDLMVFKGITERTRNCKMRCLDLRGLKLNTMFAKLIVQMLPILSLRPAQRNIRKLTNIVLKQAGLKKDNKLAQEIIPKLIKDFLSNDSTISKYAIRMLRGERMVVKIDQVQFSTQNTFFMDYLITNCLRHVTPLTVQASNVIIKSDLNVGDEILDSLAPFIVFRGQDLEAVCGIWLQNLEDNVFFIVHQDLAPFRSLRSLGLANCNISLQAGRTRRRTQARRQFSSTLASFPALTRLDLSQNSFQGVLEEIGEALAQPLEYLNLRETDLKDEDIEYLAKSRHAGSLRELNVSRVCGLYPEDDFAVSGSVLISSIKYFVNVTLLHLQQNHLSNAQMQELAETIRGNRLPRLKYVNVRDNVVGREAALGLVRACVTVPTMQLVRVPFSHNMVGGGDGVGVGGFAGGVGVGGLGLAVGGGGMLVAEKRDFEARIRDELKMRGRQDIIVDVQNLPFAVLPNM